MTFLGFFLFVWEGPSWSWSYGSWIYNYLCHRCLLPLKLWVRIPLRRGVLDLTLCDKLCQWLAAGRWFSSGTTSTNKTGRHWNIVESGIDHPNPNPCLYELFPLEEHKIWLNEEQMEKHIILTCICVICRCFKSFIYK